MCLFISLLLLSWPKKGQETKTLVETTKTIQLAFKQSAHMANKHLPSVLHKLGIMV